MIAFRQMSGSDLEAGLSLCRAAKWNQLARDWQLFLQLNPQGCRVALLDEKVIGTVTTLRYQQSFSWIGMVLVSPEHRRKGVGFQLLHEALDILHDEETVKLDATPAGREVYLRLNFADEYPLSRMQATANKNNFIHADARAITINDLPDIAAFDKQIFGADRITLIEWLWRGASNYAFVLRDSEQVKGYCLGRNGYNYKHIGPVVADNVHIAIQLVSAALQECAGEPVIIDTAYHDKSWMDWLTDIGFTEQRTFMRMYRGRNNVKSITTKQFAITGPEFG